MPTMIRPPTDHVEADLAALRNAAERARTALACLFSSSAEFEAEVIRARRASNRLPNRSYVRYAGTWAAMLVLTFLFLML